MCFFSSLKIQWIYPSKMWVKDCSWAGVNTGLKFHHEFNNVHLEGETPQSKAQHVLYLFRPPSKGVVLLNPCVYVNSLWYWNRNIHRDLISITLLMPGPDSFCFCFTSRKVGHVGYMGSSTDHRIIKITNANASFWFLQYIQHRTGWNWRDINVVHRSPSIYS